LEDHGRFNQEAPNLCKQVSKGNSQSEMDRQEFGMKTSGREHFRAPLKRTSRKEDDTGLVIP